MKIKKLFSKSLILVMLFTFGITANGCDWFGGGDDIVFSDEAKQEKRIGTLKSLGGMSVGQGTHILEMKDGDALRLRSLNINLDQEKYLNKNVEVRGPIGIASDDKEIMEVMSIDIAEDEEDDNKLKGEPKEYINADLGFELTYLDSWKIEESDEEIVFEATPYVEKEEEDAMEEADEEEEDAMEVEEELEPDTIVIKRLPNPDKEEIAEYMELPSDPNDLIELGYTRSLVGEDKIEGLKMESDDKLELEIWVTRGEYVYKFSFLGTDTPDVVNNRNTFYSMNTSFKFIGFAPEEEEEEDAMEEETSMEEEEIELPPTEDPVDEVTEEDPIEEIEEPETLVEPVEEESMDMSGAVSYGDITQYLSNNIGSIAPESSEDGSWSANNYEFVDPNYVYVDYSDGSVNRRVLLTYEANGNNVNTDVVGYFKPGETTSWDRVEGENPVASAEKTVVSVTNEGVEETATVKEGYRYFESLPYDFTAQYPSNWYFSGTGGGGDVSHHYGFSNEPVENGNELVSVDIVSSGGSGSPISVGAHSGTKAYVGSDVIIYIQRDDGLFYKVHGGTEYEQQVIDIAASIQEQ